jgi:thiamine biosynthesis lipoprotein
MPAEPATAPGADVYHLALLGRRQFRAMNTTVELYCRDLEDVSALVAAEDLFHSMESRLSRFIPDSELCRLNDLSGNETPISELMLDVLTSAIEMNVVTGGIFDPAILPALESAGYDRSFELIEADSDSPPGAATGGRFSISQLRLNPVRLTASTPAGMRIDLGGIGKGYTVDAAARLLEPVRNFVVNAGGDILARGDGPDGDGWLVAVTDAASEGRTVSLVRLHDQALATSTTAARRWRRAGQLQHHLIDPRTARPSESALVSATVIASTAVRADVFAKTVLLLGQEEGMQFLRDQGVPGLMIDESGQVTTTADWPGTSVEGGRE